MTCAPQSAADCLTVREITETQLYVGHSLSRQSTVRRRCFLWCFVWCCERPARDGDECVLCGPRTTPGRRARRLLLCRHSVPLAEPEIFRRKGQRTNDFCCPPHVETTRISPLLRSKELQRHSGYMLSGILAILLCNSRLLALQRTNTLASSFVELSFSLPLPRTTYEKRLVLRSMKCRLWQK